MKAADGQLQIIAVSLVDKGCCFRSLHALKQSYARWFNFNFSDYGKSLISSMNLSKICSQISFHINSDREFVQELLIRTSESSMLG